MPLSDDPWIAEHSIIDPERLHALGVVSVFWNHCERVLFLIFCFIFKFQPRFGWIIAHDMGDMGISDRIRELLRLSPIKPEEERLVLHMLDVYDVCRQNRNTLTHFTVRPGSKEDTTSDFRFVRLKGPSPTAKAFPSRLSDIRAVAFDIKMLSIYLMQIREALFDREGGKDTPLPPIVEVPMSLSTPRPQADKAPQPQRLPSLLRLTEEEWIAKYRKEGKPLPEREG
jgi:hypothetical protein